MPHLSKMPVETQKTGPVTQGHEFTCLTAVQISLSIISRSREIFLTFASIFNPSRSKNDSRGGQRSHQKAGLLALAMESSIDSQSGQTRLRGVPFVVPGGRLNEMYGWDSYMESIGLIFDGRVDLAKSMVCNFCFSINHYGKILSANRIYYLGRTQPPFLIGMATRVYEETKSEDDAVDFLKDAMLASIQEYYTIWTADPRFDPLTGPSRYRPEGIGVPPETESTHFVHVLKLFAEKYGLTTTGFVEAYDRHDGTVNEPLLDEYFLHDRAVRESGHDTSYRLEKIAADLATIDLNSLLYKYEIDITKSVRITSKTS